MHRILRASLIAVACLVGQGTSFTPTQQRLLSRATSGTGNLLPRRQPLSKATTHNHHKAAAATTALQAVVQDLDVIALVAGQENYGLAIVCVGEALWSFLKAPSLSHAKVLIPAGVAAVILLAVSGPMITSGDASSVGTGLWIATAVSIGLGASYVARMLAPFSPSPKEIAALGLLVAIAGFFSFSQNLVVDGFVQLPDLPSVNIFPANEFED
jgi:hypothetical protein